ncbi:AMP-binding protein, partial [Streptomyces sp. AC04842]|nr:AMP-binding protein [Streptomyces sp. AC04842]
MSNANLYAVLEGGFPADRKRVALETPELAYTWDDIDRATACLANLLTSLKLPEGARVAVQVEKSPEALLLYLATLRAGLVYLPLNTAYREAEIEYFLGNAEPAVVVCAGKNRDWVQRAADKAGCAHVYTLDEDRTGTLL